MGFLTIAARQSVSVAERCAVTSSEKLACGASAFITQADCEAINCCYDSQILALPCYYANDGEWLGCVSEPRWLLLDIYAWLLLPVTVQCTLDGRFVVVVSEKVTLPPLDLGSIQLVDSSSPSCSPVTSLSTFVVYQFPVSSCGSTVQLAGGNVTYQNTMSAAITVRSGPEGSITRDSVYKLFFQCTYSGSQDVQVEAEVYTVAPPLPVVEQGPFDLELVIATDSSYGSYYVDADYPVTKTLRDPVAVEVHIMKRTDPNLVLTLGDCWVTPGPSASSQPQWSLLVNGYVPRQRASGRGWLIFIYCVAAACYPSATDPCTRSCPARNHIRFVKSQWVPFLNRTLAVVRDARGHDPAGTPGGTGRGSEPCLDHVGFAFRVALGPRVKGMEALPVGAVVTARRRPNALGLVSPALPPHQEVLGGRLWRMPGEQPGGQPALPPHWAWPEEDCREHLGLIRVLYKRAISIHSRLESSGRRTRQKRVEAAREEGIVAKTECHFGVCALYGLWTGSE
ncbi:ZP4 protein, partial [Polypterus senegalus]